MPPGRPRGEARNELGGLALRVGVPPAGTTLPPRLVISGGISPGLIHTVRMELRAGLVLLGNRLFLTLFYS